MDTPRPRPPAPDKPVRDRSAFAQQSRVGAAPIARYSRFVSWMKIGLPLAAIAVLIAILVASGVLWPDDKIDVSYSEVAVKNDGLRMVSPRVTGLNQDGLPYTMTADTATQNPTTPNYVTLENIKAEMTLDEANGQINMKADRGLLDSDAHTLALQDNIDLFTSQGYEFHASQADINFKAGSLSSRQPVTGQGPLGTLSAETMTADHANETLHFEGKVRVVIQGDQLTRYGEEDQ